MVNTVISVFLKGIDRLENCLIILLELGKVLDPEGQQSLVVLAA